MKYSHYFIIRSLRQTELRNNYHMYIIILILKKFIELLLHMDSQGVLESLNQPVSNYNPTQLKQAIPRLAHLPVPL